MSPAGMLASVCKPCAIVVLKEGTENYNRLAGTGITKDIPVRSTA